MRTAAFVLFAALVVIACRAPREADRPSETTASRDFKIEIDPAIRERLALGLPMQLEVRAEDEKVGECVLVYDLWEERYKVALSRTEIVYAGDSDVALRHCVDVSKIGMVTTLHVREMPHLYQPRSDYPVF